MISLAIREHWPSTIRPADHENRLRNAGIWYPEIPGPDLCLHEQSFPPLDLYLDGYKPPLFWCHFGGPGGMYLSHLTRISATWSCGIRRMEFCFNTEVPAEFRSLGRLEAEASQKDFDFIIDGPGGERIESIEICHEYHDPERPRGWLVTEGALRWCQVRRGRFTSTLASLRHSVFDSSPLPLPVSSLGLLTRSSRCSHGLSSTRISGDHVSSTSTVPSRPGFGGPGSRRCR